MSVFSDSLVGLNTSILSEFGEPITVILAGNSAHEIMGVYFAEGDIGRLDAYESDIASPYVAIASKDYDAICASARAPESHLGDTVVLADGRVFAIISVTTPDDGKMRNIALRDTGITI